MGKKGKPLKIKQYKVPMDSKFLVVIKPWQVTRNFDRDDIDRIGAWFDHMIAAEYPDSGFRLKAIYYQRTHSNIIVELPKGITNIESFLGSHFYSEFVLNAEQPLDDSEAADIYEYKYATYGDPSKNSFSVNHPEYVPDKYPIRNPYPLPSPAPPPPMDVQYAQAIPREVNERIANRLRAHNQKNVSASVKLEPGTSKSMDPTPLSNASSQNDFIPYIRPCYLIQATGRTTPEYKPSAELLEALGSLPEDLIELNVQSKAEENIKLEPSDETMLLDYRPSDDLLVALATLPDDMEFPGFKSTSSQPKRPIHGVVGDTCQSPSKRIKREDVE